MRTGPVVRTAALLILPLWVGVVSPGLPATSLAAQSAPATPAQVVDARTPADSLSAGQRLRVRTFDGTTYDGRLMDLTSTELSLRAMGVPVAVPRATIERVDVHRGTVSGSRSGAIWTGLITGVIGGVAYRNFCVGLGSCTNQFGVAAVGFAVAGAGGAMLGAIGGLAFRSDRWEAIPFGRESN